MSDSVKEHQQCDPPASPEQGVGEDFGSASAPQRSVDDPVVVPTAQLSHAARFLYEAMDVIAEGEMHDEVWWHTSGGTKAPRLLVRCNDFFWWGTADCEEITPANLHHLRAAITECDAIPEYEGTGWEGRLFCAKARGLRPQGCCYPKEAAVAALFDACGPKREVTFMNPYAHPEDGGKYEYRPTCEAAKAATEVSSATAASPAQESNSPLAAPSAREEQTDDGANRSSPKENRENLTHCD